MSCERMIGPYPCCSVVQGDCLKLMAELPDGCVDAVITDPPYGVAYTGKQGSGWEQIANDDGVDWVEPIFGEVFRVLSRSGICLSFYGWKHADTFVSSWKRHGFRLISHMLWVKNVWGLGHFTRSQHETAYLLGKADTRKPTSAISDVLEWTRDSEFQHPCQKPVEALEPIVSTFCDESDTILDPFCGSGTTLVAAKKLGRHFLGFEISPEYCEIARDRLRRIDDQPNLFTPPKAEQMPLAPPQPIVSSLDHSDPEEVVL